MQQDKEDPPKTTLDLFEKNIKRAIRSNESLLPLYIKGFSDFYREYNSYVDQIFRMMKTGEKKLGMYHESNAEQAYHKYIESFFDLYQNQFSTSKEFLKRYLQMRVLFLKSYNEYLKKTIEVYENA